MNNPAKESEQTVTFHLSEGESHRPQAPHLPLH
jgi:hypothetical protein